ncbi:hypothetical protein [Roseibium sp.]|uniref:hypothetical protein n=1 Tax=Roseibium sp. TaxID=1936156 RepID=UPI003A9876EB
MNSPKSFKEHFGEPDISIDQHANRRIKALGQSLRSRRAVYLDMCFWIMLRDAIRSHSIDTARKLLDLLREKTKAGLIFCPISENTFVELMKQSDPTSRTMTAALIDELSLGITLIPEDMRVGTEVAHFLYKNSGHTDLYPLEELVWCKLSYVLGILHPYKTPFDPSTERAIQKAFFDHMWTIPLMQMVEQIGDTEIPGRDFSNLANDLNAGIAEHAHELRSFKQAYKAEAWGVVDIAGAIAADTIPEIAAAKGIILPEPTSEERQQAENSYKNLMALALEKGKAQKELRTMHILASLHASLRWNKGQKVVSNGIFDFHHATAALAYCDAFFSEGPLCTMIQQKHLQLDKQFECYVTPDIEDAVVWIEGLN